jgi:succinoglycan biosynthesis transport protein ExoP
MYFGPTLRSIQPLQLPSGSPTIPPEQSAQGEIAGLLGTLARRKRVMVAIFVIFFSLVVLWMLVIPKKYTAEIKLIAGASSSTATRDEDTTLPLLNALLAASSTMSAETYTDLIQQYPVAAQVVQNLHLSTDPSQLLQQHIVVTPVTNTSILALDATWKDPETAIKIANEFGNVFVERERELIAGQATAALDFLSKQLPVAEANMHKADDALAAFEAAHPNVYVAASSAQSTGSSNSDSAVLAAQQKYAQTQVDLQQAKAQLGAVAAQMNSTEPTINGSSDIVQNPVTEQLKSQLATVDVQLQSARQQYTDQYPTVVALKEQKAQLEREISSQTATVVSGNTIVPNPVYQQLAQQADTLRAQIAGDQGQIRTLNAELGRSTKSNSSLPAETMRLADLQRDAQMAEDVYTALQQKYGEATVAQTTALSDVAITQPASDGTVSVNPKWKIVLVIAVALGLAMAISGAFIVDFFDNTFKDEQDVQRALPLPVLTSVPKLTTSSSRGKLPWLRALTVESFLQLVTALKYSLDKPLRTLAITSPSQLDGKTTVAMSTAIAMAEIEPKVLLIDADMRLPDIHKRLGLETTPGLSDVLVGEVPVSEAIQSTKYDGLYALTGGTKVPNPMKLIHSPKFDELIAGLCKDYRAIVFDTPALQPVYDAAILAAKCDGAILVVSAGMTEMPATKRALERLGSVQGVNMLGIVLNRSTPTNGYQTYYLSGGMTTPLPHENGIVSPS